MSREISSIDNFSFRVIKKVGLAINRYNMIGENDRIIVAVSGGKDSLTLLKSLVLRRLWVPMKYEVVAVNVQSDMHCSGCVHRETLSRLFEEMKVEYHFEEIEILKRLKEKGERLNCFFCSWNRRKALFLATRKYNCNKIAMGHHMDDVIHTILMNLIVHGKREGMEPKVSFFNGEFELIRPLFFVREAETRRFAELNNLPHHLCRCPESKRNIRVEMRRLVEEMNKVNNKAYLNIFASMYGNPNRQNSQ
ncbi:MAG: tRNA 2-thiocytidine biosynthesis TtcA family protein [Myxococcota bacterium]